MWSLVVVNIGFCLNRKDWALVSESDNRAPDCPIVRFAGVCTKSDVVNLVFEPDAR